MEHEQDECDGPLCRVTRPLPTERFAVHLRTGLANRTWPLSLRLPSGATGPQAVQPSSSGAHGSVGGLAGGLPASGRVG